MKIIEGLCMAGLLIRLCSLTMLVGTLVAPSQPMAQIYRQIGDKYGVEYSEEEILNRYRRAYEKPWGQSRLRYVGDARPFWQHIVISSTSCSDPQYFEELYNYYMTDKAWHLCDPEAEKVFSALRKAGVKAAVVSNFDTRLRQVLRALNCDHRWLQRSRIQPYFSRLMSFLRYNPRMLFMLEMTGEMTYGVPEMLVVTPGFGEAMSILSMRFLKG